MPEFGVCLVTGGNGFIGTHVVDALADTDHEVRVLDLKIPADPNPKATYIAGDIRDRAALDRACKGVNTVFHLAAEIDLVGMRPPAERESANEANVEGTRNVVDASAAAGVTRLVHTSSNNVVFATDAISGGDESLPYVEHSVDTYTTTKAAGEQVALDADGRGRLRVVAVRPGGVYGPGDELALGRVVEATNSGLFLATFGDGSARTDFIYVDDVAGAELLAARRLGEDPAKIGGRAFFISDGEPTNSFWFFRPLLNRLGLRFPRVRLPRAFGVLIAFVWELAHRLHLTPEPFLSRAEINKITLDNWYRIDAAQADLGFAPTVDREQGHDRCMVWLEQRYGDEIEVVDRPAWAWFAVLDGGLAVLALLTFVRRSRWLRWLFAAALVTHVGEAVWAFRYARRAGLRRSAPRWAAQTFVVGFPSLRLLVEAARRRSRRDAQTG